LLERAVARNLGDGILLSGGLDTSVLAVLASKHVRLKAFTIAFQGAPAPDIEYATLMAKYLGLKHAIHFFNEGELYGAVSAVVKTLSSFDPMEVRNSVTIHVAMRTAKENGVRAVITGDGCDELLAGYSFLFKLEKERLELELRKLWEVMSFSSVPLAEALEWRRSSPTSIRSSSPLPWNWILGTRSELGGVRSTASGSSARRSRG